MMCETPESPYVARSAMTTRFTDCVRCRFVTKYASDMISVHDFTNNARILYVSPAAESLFGYTAKELIGKSPFEFIHPDDRTAVRAFAQQQASGPDIVTLRYRLLLKAGGFEWVESTCRAIIDPLTELPAEVVATTRSVADRVARERAQSQLLEDSARARTDAERANRAKDEFLTMMSHEFRTPLNAIAGHLQLLQLGIHGPITEEQNSALDRIDRAQRHLLRLVNDILNVERLRTGQLEYDVQPVRVRDLVAEVEPMVEPLLRAGSLSYNVNVPDDAVVLADGEKLLQVLINLVSNAIKFTPPGGTIAIDCPQRANGGTPEDMRYIRVRDTGAGIALEKQASIFEPFVQVDVTLARRAKGAGLGLAISRDLSRGMAGDLRVRSDEGRGASFTVAMPRAEDVPAIA